MLQSRLHEVAVGYLLLHQGEHLAPDRARLVERCAEHLLASENDVMSLATARLIALQSLGAIESRGNNAHVDLDTSTSFAVFVVDPVNKVRFAFTAADLIRLARDQASRSQHASIKH